VVDHETFRVREGERAHMDAPFGRDRERVGKTRSGRTAALVEGAALPLLQV
jgi:hypothetical protein